MDKGFRNTAFLLTGGNTADRQQHLQAAKINIEKYCGHIIAASSIYETAAWGLTNQPSFYNQALQLQTNMPAEELMQTLLNIEEEMGRVRTVKMGPRIIDIDILFLNDEIINTSFLSVPHPYLHQRRFALIPLAEIAPQLIHPILKKNIDELLELCGDELPVKKKLTDEG